ncbi:MAG: tetratricopeptide repeat protein [Alphaproteobacteria bacterium]|nr:tetratricopeptide repeat protein [Alphaproteobacteria bacterium]
MPDIPRRTPKPAPVDRVREAERLLQAHQLAAAEAVLRDVLTDLRLAPRLPAELYARARNAMAQVYIAAGRRDAAIEVLDHTLDRLAPLLDTPPEGFPPAGLARIGVELAHAQIRLAGQRRLDGDLQGARELVDVAIQRTLRRAMVLWEQHLPPDVSLASGLSRMAVTLLDQGEAAHAERLLRMELQERERVGHSIRRVSRTRIHLGQTLMTQNRCSEAEALFRTALDQRRRSRAPQDATSKARCWLAMCILAQGRTEESERLLLEGLSEMRALGEHPRARAALRYSLARVNLAQGRTDEAKDILRRGLEDLRGGPVRDPHALAEHAMSLAQILQLEGQAQDAETLLLDTLREAQAGGLSPRAMHRLQEQLAEASRERQTAGALSSAQHTTLRGLQMRAHFPGL